MTKLEERLNHAADEDAKLLRSQDSPLEMNRRTFKAGAKFILEMPELKALIKSLEDFQKDYEEYNDHCGTWDIDDGLIDHSEDCLKCKIQNSLDAWRTFIGDESNSSEIPNSSKESETL